MRSSRTGVGARRPAGAQAARPKATHGVTRAWATSVRAAAAAARVPLAPLPRQAGARPQHHRHGLARRPTGQARTKQSGLELLHPADSSAAPCCQHPDAVRRRLEQLEWQRQRMSERMHQSALGRRWYEAPSTLVTCNNADEYRALVAQATREGRLLVAKFFTEECWVCKSIHPKVVKIAAENPDVLWVKLNGSDAQLVSLFHSLGITKVPLFHMVRDGQLVAELTASLSPEKLAAFRAELAAHKPPPPSSSGTNNTVPAAQPEHGGATTSGATVAPA